MMSLAEERRKMSIKNYIAIYWPLIGTFFVAIGAWYRLQYGLGAVEKELADKSQKYIPMIEMTEHRVTIVEERERLILEGLQRIERKIDRQ